ncbi:hypothetical protein [Methylobacillus sp.]|uniref:hypothetical protein n=1 Tax=Methylobacillus sp. TaxID=56818 RepID=UPI00257BDF3F|nr:hypothetical protein [Methylobacillus sp.]
MSDTRNVKTGVSKLFLDGVDLGYTQGGVEFSSTTETHKVTVDQFGNTAIKESIIGRTCSVNAPLAETTLTNLASLFPTNPNNAANGAGSVGTTAVRVGIDSGVGVDLLETAKTLVIHPYGLPDWDYSDDIIIPLANTPGALTFAYRLEEERVFNVDFTGYPDPQTQMLFFAGNPFTDAPDKTFAISATAAAAVVTGTGFGATAAASKVHGKPVLIGGLTQDAALPGVTFRAKYYAKWVSATTISLHKNADLSDTAVAITGASSGLVKLAVLA